jgi:hypothetical protein
MTRYALLVLLLAGCGTDPKPAPAPKRTAAQAQAGAVAERFVRALGRHDWTAACATRSYDDLLALAREAGTCERALTLAFKGKDVALLARTVAGQIRVDGDTAGIDMVQRGGRRPVLRLFAVRESGSWRLQDVTR